MQTHPDKPHRGTLVDETAEVLAAESYPGHQHVLKLKAPTLVYVSCDVATLARDARKLVEAGYRCERVMGFDLFPNTPHVEAVVTFRR